LFQESEDLLLDLRSKNGWQLLQTIPNKVSLTPRSPLGLLHLLNLRTLLSRNIFSTDQILQMRKL
jgi:hypothetical protein